MAMMIVCMLAINNTIVINQFTFHLVFRQRNNSLEKGLCKFFTSCDVWNSTPRTNFEGIGTFRHLPWINAWLSEAWFFN